MRGFIQRHLFTTMKPNSHRFIGNVSAKERLPSLGKRPVGITLILVLAVVALRPAMGAEPGELRVHEWGTFTSVVGSDGVALAGLETEEEPLPGFVHSLGAPAAGTKGIGWPVQGVTIKMETPVLYFYAARETAVNVRVGFHGGSISQWYPQRTGGEQAPQLSAGQQVGPVDFSRGYDGKIEWRATVLPRGTNERPTPRPADETPQWPRARVASANLVRGANGETEGFLFYRGVGSFALPLAVRAERGGVVVANRGGEEIPFVFVYEKRGVFPQGVVWWSGRLDRGETKTVPLLKSRGDIAARPVVEETFPRALQAAGLTGEEARAMLATWHESYFGREGLRVFWIVPRSFTDAILPLAIEPRPRKIERVLVGRTEVLTAEFESVLMREFAQNGGERWSGGRFFSAFRERVQRLGGAVGVAPVSPTP
jgi:hypothetical protein